MSSMNIRPRVLILLSLVFVALSSVAILIQEMVVMPSFARLEQANAQTAMHRVRHAMDRNLEALEVSAVDWANWGDVYRFVQDQNLEFISINVTQAALNQLQVNTMLIVARDGKVVMSSRKYVQTDI